MLIMTLRVAYRKTTRFPATSLSTLRQRNTIVRKKTKKAIRCDNLKLTRCSESERVLEKKIPNKKVEEVSMMLIYSGSIEIPTIIPLPSAKRIKKPRQISKAIITFLIKTSKLSATYFLNFL